MLKWIARKPEDEKIEDAIRFGPPYASQVLELTAVLHGDLARKRITPGHS
jgi:hypothetical protein